MQNEGFAVESSFSVVLFSDETPEDWEDMTLSEQIDYIASDENNGKPE